jgi:hypothetical protein
MNAEKRSAPERATVHGARISQQETSTTRGRCVQCGRATDLVKLAEGFHGLGWCEHCEREFRQPMFTLGEAWPQ